MAHDSILLRLKLYLEHLGSRSGEFSSSLSKVKSDSSLPLPDAPGFMHDLEALEAYLDTLHASGSPLNVLPIILNIIEATVLRAQKAAPGSVALFTEQQILTILLNHFFTKAYPQACIELQSLSSDLLAQISLTDSVSEETFKVQNYYHAVSHRPRTDPTKLHAEIKKFFDVSLCASKKTGSDAPIPSTMFAATIGLIFKQAMTNWFESINEHIELDNISFTSADFSSPSIHKDEMQEASKRQAQHFVYLWQLQRAQQANCEFKNILAQCRNYSSLDKTKLKTLANLYKQFQYILFHPLLEEMTLEVTVQEKPGQPPLELISTTKQLDLDICALLEGNESPEGTRLPLNVSRAKRQAGLCHLESLRSGSETQLKLERFFEQQISWLKSQLNILPDEVPDLVGSYDHSFIDMAYPAFLESVRTEDLRFEGGRSTFILAEMPESVTMQDTMALIEKALAQKSELVQLHNAFNIVSRVFHQYRNLPANELSEENRTTALNALKVMALFVKEHDGVSAIEDYPNDSHVCADHSLASAITTLYNHFETPPDELNDIQIPLLIQVGEFISHHKNAQQKRIEDLSKKLDDTYAQTVSEQPLYSGKKTDPITEYHDADSEQLLVAKRYIEQIKLTLAALPSDIKASLAEEEAQISLLHERHPSLRYKPFHLLRLAFIHLESAVQHVEQLDSTTRIKHPLLPYETLNRSLRLAAQLLHTQVDEATDRPVYVNKYQCSEVFEFTPSMNVLFEQLKDLHSLLSNHSVLPKPNTIAESNIEEISCDIMDDTILPTHWMKTLKAYESDHDNCLFTYNGTHYTLESAVAFVHSIKQALISGEINQQNAVQRASDYYHFVPQLLQALALFAREHNLASDQVIPKILEQCTIPLLCQVDDSYQQEGFAKFLVDGNLDDDQQLLKLIFDENVAVQAKTLFEQHSIQPIAQEKAAFQETQDIYIELANAIKSYNAATGTDDQARTLTQLTNLYSAHRELLNTDFPDSGFNEYYITQLPRRYDRKGRAWNAAVSTVTFVPKKLWHGFNSIGGTLFSSKESPTAQQLKPSVADKMAMPTTDLKTLEKACKTRTEALQKDIDLRTQQIDELTTITDFFDQLQKDNNEAEQRILKNCLMNAAQRTFIKKYLPLLIKMRDHYLPETYKHEWFERVTTTLKSLIEPSAEATSTRLLDDAIRQFNQGDDSDPSTKHNFQAALSLISDTLDSSYQGFAALKDEYSKIKGIETMIEKFSQYLDNPEWLAEDKASINIKSSRLRTLSELIQEHKNDPSTALQAIKAHIDSSGFEVAMRQGIAGFSLSLQGITNFFGTWMLRLARLLIGQTKLKKDEYTTHIMNLVNKDISSSRATTVTPNSEGDGSSVAPIFRWGDLFAMPHAPIIAEVDHTATNGDVPPSIGSHHAASAVVVDDETSDLEPPTSSVMFG